MRFKHVKGFFNSVANLKKIRNFEPVLYHLSVLPSLQHSLKTVPNWAIGYFRISFIFALLRYTQ